MFVQTSAGLVFVSDFKALDLHGRLEAVFVEGNSEDAVLSHSLSVGDWVDMPVRQKLGGETQKYRFWVDMTGFSRTPVPIFGMKQCGYRA